MRARSTVVAAGTALVLSGCIGLGEERVCGGGEYPVKPADGGMGGACAKDGDDPPEGFEAYPEGQVPEVVGDRWDTYWGDRQAEVTSRQITDDAVETLRSTDAPQGWTRVDVGEIGSIAMPPDWTAVQMSGDVALEGGDASVEVTLEPGAASTLDTQGDAIRDEGTDASAPVFDVDTPVTWPGADDARYIRADRGVPGEDGYTATEALLLVTADGSLLTVRGTSQDQEITQDTEAWTILRTLLVGGTS